MADCRHVGQGHAGIVSEATIEERKRPFGACFRSTGERRQLSRLELRSVRHPDVDLLGRRLHRHLR